MGKILLIVPYDAIQYEVDELLKPYRAQGMIIDTTHVVGVEDTKRLNVELYDIMIARGITYATLKKLHKDRQIIPIEVAVSEMIQVIAEAKKNYEPKKIAVVGWAGMIQHLEVLGQLCDVHIRCFHVKGDIQARKVVERIKEEGYDVLVGGLMVCQIASELNLANIFVKTPKETIQRAVDQAIHTSQAITNQKRKTELFKTIMDYLGEGVIAVDEKGEVITVNKSARKILGFLEKQKLGKKEIEEILNAKQLDEIIQSGEAKTNLLEKYRGDLLSANVLPLQVKGQVKGVVKLFQPVEKIKQMETQIRKTLYKKGLVAKYEFKDLIGDSPIMKRAIHFAKRYSKVDSNILLVGETGTGKELFAQSIHNESVRREGPFVAINCAALPENLLETELFGYVEGAFTGAVKGGKIGFFELAHTGTVFLDEINEISLSLQSKLLRVLETKEIRRVGDERVIPVDIRIITATNVNLYEKVEHGEFRRDLLYRLNVLDLKIPPLRSRQRDVLMIGEYYITYFNNKFNKQVRGFDEEAKQKLINYHWPGNIRELKNICERLMVLTDDIYILEDEVKEALYNMPDMLDIIERGWGEEVAASQRNDVAIHKSEANKVLSVEALEVQNIREALVQSGNNKSDAAKLLGISRSTLWRKLKELEEFEQ